MFGLGAALPLLIFAVQDEFPLREKLAWSFDIAGEDRAVERRVEENIGKRWVVRDPGLPGMFDRLAFEKTEEGVNLVRTLQELEAPVRWLPLPLKEGAEWSGEIRAGEGRSFRAKLSGKVLGPDEVQVPAGTFSSVRLRIVIEVEDGSRLELEIWIAAKAGPVRRVVKTTVAGKTRKEIHRLARMTEGETVLYPGKSGKKSRAWSRPSDGCSCEEDYPFQTCRCLHCAGEKGARCYCDTGGCRCGLEMPECACGHCTGVPGGDDDKGNCT